MATKITCAGKTDVGLKRTNNEDNFIVVPSAGLYVLADGMGGHASGQVASAMCVSHVAQFICETSKQPGFEFPYKRNPAISYEANLLVNAIKFANERVFIQSCKDRSMEGMGTTVTAILNAPHGLVLAHVGDSRIYRVRKGQITQMSRDHSLLNHLIDKGEIRPEDAKSFTKTNVILRAIGLKDAVEVEVKEVPREQGDLYMMCSDGLSDIVSDTLINQAINNNLPNLQEICNALIGLALKAGGKDNVTTVCVYVEQEDGAASQPSQARMNAMPTGMRSAPKPGAPVPGAPGMRPGMPMPGAPMNPAMMQRPGMPMQSQPGMMPIQSGMKPMPSQPGMMPMQPGMKPMQPGMPGQPGMMPMQPGMKPMQPGMMPMQPGMMPMQPGMMPMQPGMMPMQPGMMPMQPGMMPMQPGMMPMQPAAPAKPMRQHSVRMVVEIPVKPKPEPEPEPVEEKAEGAASVESEDFEDEESAGATVVEGQIVTDDMLEKLAAAKAAKEDNGGLSAEELAELEAMDDDFDDDDDEDKTVVTSKAKDFQQMMTGQAPIKGYVAPKAAITPPKDDFDDGDSIEIGPAPSRRW